MNTSLSQDNEYKLFTFHATYENVHALLMDVHLYVFGQDGNLIESQAIRRDKAVVAISEDELRHAKIVIAPALEAAAGKPLSFEIVGGQYAFELDVQLDGGQSSYVLPPVPEVIWRWWLVRSLWSNIPVSILKKNG